MPAYSTHYLFAYELMDEVKKNVNFAIDEQAVYIGTQGPDIFYDHRILPWMCGKSLRKVGSICTVQSRVLSLTQCVVM